MRTATPRSLGPRRCTASVKEECVASADGPDRLTGAGGLDLVAGKSWNSAKPYCRTEYLHSSPRHGPHMRRRMRWSDKKGSRHWRQGHQSTLSGLHKAGECDVEYLFATRDTVIRQRLRLNDALPRMSFSGSERPRPCDRAHNPLHFPATASCSLPVAGGHE